jgi:hypothetical protein
MLTDEYGVTMGLQPAKKTGKNPVLVVFHHKIQTVYLDVMPAPHGAKQDLISRDKAQSSDTELPNTCIQICIHGPFLLQLVHFIQHKNINSNLQTQHTFGN